MTHLSAEERGVIEYGLEKGLKVNEIAFDLNRHPSTIYREIKRIVCLKERIVFMRRIPIVRLMLEI